MAKKIFDTSKNRKDLKLTIPPIDWELDKYIVALKDYWAGEIRNLFGIPKRR